MNSRRMVNFILDRTNKIKEFEIISMDSFLLSKSIFIILLLISNGFSYSQTIQSKNHTTTGYIKSDGTIQDKNHSTVGYVKKDGTVQDKNHSTLGYIKNDGTVQDKNHSTIGYAKGVNMYWSAVTFFFFDF